MRVCKRGMDSMPSRKRTRNDISDNESDEESIASVSSEGKPTKLNVRGGFVSMSRGILNVF